MSLKSFALAAALAVFAGGSAQALSIKSTFDTTTEGWGVINDGSAPAWGADFGRTGPGDGGIRSSDFGSGTIWSFVAPAAYRGDLSAFYGGTLDFSLITDISGARLAATNMVQIVTGTGTLSRNLAAGLPLENVWTDFSFGLTEADGWTFSGGALTEASFRTALSNVSNLYIRGEFGGSSGDVSRLDNVALSAIPLPPAAALLGVGLLGLAAIRRRQTAA